MIKTLQFKLRNPNQKWFELATFEANQVWNYCNNLGLKALTPYFETYQYHGITPRRGYPSLYPQFYEAKWLSEFDFSKYLTGSTYHPVDNPNGFQAINFAVTQAIAHEFVTRRLQFKKAKLKFRKSVFPQILFIQNQEKLDLNSQLFNQKSYLEAHPKPKKSKVNLGWIPLKLENITIRVDGARLSGKQTKPSKKAQAQKFFQEMKFFETSNKNSSSFKLILLNPKKLQGFKLFLQKELELSQLKLLAKQQKDKAKFLRIHQKEKIDVRIQILGKDFRIFNQEYLNYYLNNLNAEIRSGNFSQDSCGDWYLNLQVKIEDALYFNEHLIKTLKIPEIAPFDSVGIDPNIETFLVLSDGKTFESQQFYQESQKKLATLQRCGRFKEAGKLSRKIKRRRNDYLQKSTSEIVKNYQNIKIGDLKVQALVKKKPSKEKVFKLEKEKAERDLKIKQKQEKFEERLLNKGMIKESKDARTLTSKRSQGHKPRFAKSMLDNGIGKARELLLYKGHWARRVVNVVSEMYTTQVCSKCDAFTGPVGLRQLGVRNWVCSNCKFEHNRDECSGQNIERVIPGLTLPESVPRCGHLLSLKKESDRNERTRKKNSFGAGKTKPFSKQG